MGTEHLAQMIRRSCEKHADLPALGYLTDTGWQTYSYRETGRWIDSVARSLIHIGVEVGDRVAIFSPNRPEWTVADLAIASAGAVSVPIFATSTAAQAAHILGDADVTTVFASRPEEHRLLIEAAGEGALRIVTFDEGVDGNLWIRAMGDPGKESAVQAELDQRVSSGDDDGLATLIYTSGTTGAPKGVMLTHANFAHQSRSVETHFDVGPGDRSLCFLPLAHVYERSWTAHLMASGACNYYLKNPREVIAALGQVKPTVMVSVPRLYEKVHDAVLDRASRAPALRRKLFSWGLNVGNRVAQHIRTGRSPGLGLTLQHKLADRLILSKIRAVVGGDKKFFSAGGAPLAREIEEFFHAVGLLICQGYGLTESSPMATCNTPSCFRFGSVGKAVPECEVKIGDGNEILVRGPNIMMGYLNRAEETAETLADGWLHTGDQGRFDDDGFLFITGRIKDLIITSGGKNIAPQQIESAVGRDPIIDQVAVIGDRRKFITALVVPNFEAVEAWANDHSFAASTREELVKIPEVLELVSERLEAQSIDLAHYERIKKFTLLSRELTIESGELTPTLKIRRQVVEDRFAELIEAMYTNDADE
ncbi:MAG: long-chain fatty acid--CoA ligase [bacterium]|nr:long-chain fatty acid--CoA ligase [bacterium]